MQSINFTLVENNLPVPSFALTQIDVIKGESLLALQINGGQSNNLVKVVTLTGAWSDRNDRRRTYPNQASA